MPWPSRQAFWLRRLHPRTATTGPKANPRAERALASDLGRIFNAPVMEQGLWGVEVESLDSGRVLYALNARKLMMQASNMKMVALAAVGSVGLGLPFQDDARHRAR